MGQKPGSNDRKIELIEQLVLTNSLKVGQFTLKSGHTSNCYVDLRETTMHPLIFNNIVELIKDVIPQKKQHQDWLSASKEPSIAIVGVPYGVVPVAAAVAYSCKLAYYPVRKEVKEYGHKPDSNAFSNFQYILIEDVMSTGSSIVDTITKLEGKNITDVIVIVDRELGGEEKLMQQFPNIRLHSILKISQILQVSERFKKQD